MNSLLVIFEKINAFFGKPFMRIGFFALITAAIFILIYILNCLHPLFGDDWMYGIIGDHRITSFSEILQVQYEHYFEWGGRTVNHIIVQSMLLIGEPYNHILNSIAFVCYILVMYYMANGKKPINIALLIGIFMLVWFFRRNFGYCFLWITGSGNYLWGTLIIITFFSFYWRSIFKMNTKDSYAKCFLFFIAGIIAGWTNENPSVALVFMLIVLQFYYKRVNGTIPKWSLSGLIGAAIGCCTLILAPGNMVRVEYLRVAESKASAGSYTLTALMDNFVRMLFGTYYNILPVLFVFCLVLVLYVVYGNKENRSKVSFAVALAFSGAVIATLAMVGSPVFPDSVTISVNTFLFIAIGTMYANMHHTMIKRLAQITVIYALLVFAMDYHFAYRWLNYVHDITSKRVEMIEESKAKGQLDVVVEGYPLEMDNFRFVHYWEASPNPEDSPNKWIRRYYEIDSYSFIRK